MAASYTLYYWPIPFRGQFIRYVLAYCQALFDEPDASVVRQLKTCALADTPHFLMAPPVLHDHAADLWLSQLVAIMMYLGRQHDLLPGDAARDALTLKVICDCNDVLDDITRTGGRTLWTGAEWRDFAAVRLPRWMQIFETLGRQHGMGEGGGDKLGHLLGTTQPTLADLAAAALWFTMVDKLPVLDDMLEHHAPAIAALSRRVANLPAIAAMRQQQDARLGQVYCGGQIEASIRAML